MSESVLSSVELRSMLMTPGALASWSAFVTAGGGRVGFLDPLDMLEALLLRPPTLGSRSEYGIAPPHSSRG